MQRGHSIFRNTALLGTVKTSTEIAPAANQGGLDICTSCAIYLDPMFHGDRKGMLSSGELGCENVGQCITPLSI